MNGGHWWRSDAAARKVGKHVQLLEDRSIPGDRGIFNVPKGTTGTVVDVYGFIPGGYMGRPTAYLVHVKWDLPGAPLDGFIRDYYRAELKELPAEV